MFSSIVVVDLTKDRALLLGKWCLFYRHRHESELIGNLELLRTYTCCASGSHVAVVYVFCLVELHVYLVYIHTHVLVFGEVVGD